MHVQLATAEAVRDYAGCGMYRCLPRAVGAGMATKGAMYAPSSNCNVRGMSFDAGHPSMFTG